MKTNQLASWFAVGVCGLALTAARAAETASVAQNHVNVRGQASLSGEVITQLQKGEKVVVLEEIPVATPKKGEPAKWARIQMPANTPVWVFAAYFDANKAVSVTRVNLRAGPGENYSVVGRLEKGDTVKEIRRVEDWMEIEAPDKAYAFVAMDLLSKSEAAPAPALTKSEKPGAAPVPTPTVPERISPPVVAAQPVTAPSPLKESTIADAGPSTADKPSVAPPQPPPLNPATVAETTPAVSNTVAAAPTPIPTAPPQDAPVAAPAVTTPADAAAERSSTDAAPPPKRIVRREGVVRSTKSIQAPTYFELVGPDTRKVINFLHTFDPELKLKDFKGKRIVVTGEEGIDPRWPNTPIIEAETIEVAP